MTRASPLALACRTNVETLLGRRLAEWTGLVPGCTGEDLTTWLTFRDGEGLAHAGTTLAEYRFRVLSHSGFREGVEFYFGRGELSFIATDYWSLDRDECDRLLTALGEPPRRLTFHWRESSVDAGEWLYPSRGLSLGVMADTRLIARAVVFPPCSADVYKERYYNVSPAREFRLPAHGG